MRGMPPTEIPPHRPASSKAKMLEAWINHIIKDLHEARTHALATDNTIIDLIERALTALLIAQTLTITPRRNNDELSPLSHVQNEIAIGIGRRRVVPKM